MEKEYRSTAPQEYRNNISKVVLEPEKPYGIYLPDWNSVVHAVNTFSRSEYQSTAPIPKTQIVFESELRRLGNPPTNELNIYTQEELRDYINFTGDPAYQSEIDRSLNAVKSHLEKGDAYQLDDGYATRGVVQLSSKDGKNPFFIGGRTFYKTDVTIEALRSERKSGVTVDDRRYREPYLLTIYSDLNNDNPEAILREALNADQPALPRRVKVGITPKGYGQITMQHLTDKLNDVLSTEDDTKISRTMVASCMRDHKTASLGIYDGLELKMSRFSPQHMLNAGPLPFGIEFIIADPTLESRIYGTSNIIPPEKRQSAQALSETIVTAFRS